MMVFLIDMTMTLRIVDYFESTYDVEHNLHSKEVTAQKSDDKPSILGQIRAYQNESKTEEKQKTKEQEILR